MKLNAGAVKIKLCLGVNEIESKEEFYFEMERATKCASCDGSIEEIGGTIFRCCDHYGCRNCLLGAMQFSKTTTVRCLLNAGRKKIICPGFLNSSDIKWVVSPEEYESFLQRFDKLDRDDNAPSQGISRLVSSDDSKDTDEVDHMNQEETEFVEETDEFTAEADSGHGSIGFEQISITLRRLQSLHQMSSTQAALRLNEQRLWENVTEISCRICFEEEIAPGEAIIFRDCLHMFCKTCVKRYIESTDTALIKCPYTDDDYTCASFLSPSEVKSLVSAEVYARHYEELSLKEAVDSSANVFQCRTPNCQGFCFIDTEFTAGSMIFQCPNCRGRNCIPCQVIHGGNCADYWQKLEDEENRVKELLRQEAEKQRQIQVDERNRLVQRENERQSEEFINQNLTQRNFMRCPKCNIPCYKFTGCNHVTCSKCKHNFNWSGNEPTIYR